MMNFRKIFGNATALAVIVILITLGQALAAGGKPLFFEVVEKNTAGKLFDGAIESLKNGAKEDALKKFESALVSDQSLLLRNDSGLCEMLIKKYEEAAVNICEVAVYYKLAHLYDLTGKIEKAVENYKLALKTSVEKEVLDDITKKLESLNRELALYKTENSPAITPVEPAPAAPAVKPVVKNDYEEFKKVNDAKIAELKEKIREMDEKLAAKAEELSKLKNSERMAKNDWTKNTDFQRDWRDTPNETASDSEDPYQSTTRRRFRQAKKAREYADTEIESLKKQKEEMEKSLYLVEPPAGENDGQQQ